ncbi:hypothetical protein NQ317_011497 [Molorchus minor]|uniref:Uncharacterized protein n=1 Tax=Molorchus minor TaxID=1323400 RepID=A0ABQ9J1M0_9CUCU|nr:hypothetical protein NQ317_011497 [Molorchus minor]
MKETKNNGTKLETLGFFEGGGNHCIALTVKDIDYSTFLLVVLRENPTIKKVFDPNSFMIMFEVSASASNNNDVKGWSANIYTYYYINHVNLSFSQEFINVRLVRVVGPSGLLQSCNRIQ